MDYVAITLTSPLLAKAKDLILPLDVPLYLLIDSLIQGLKIDLPDGSMGVLYLLNDLKKRKLLPTSTLRDAGVRFGQFMALEYKSVSAKATLQCLHGPEFEIDRNEMSIGCSAKVDIDLRSVPYQEVVSSIHAKIITREGNYYIKDLKSMNGTTVNGTPIEPETSILLKNEDVIILGISENEGVQLIFRLRK